MTQTLEQLQKEYDQVIRTIHGYRSNTVSCTTEEYNAAFSRGTELLRLMRDPIHQALKFPPVKSGFNCSYPSY